MGRRQTALYVHTVDLYKPDALKLDLTGSPADVMYPATPTYSGVACYRESKQEATQPERPGLKTNVDNIFTVDVFHFYDTQDISGNWAIKFNVTGHPDDGQWFITVGETMVKNWRAGKQSVQAKRSTKPAGVA